MLDGKMEQGTICTGDSVNEATIQLRQEELEIIKNRIQTGEVNIYREFIQEEKTLTIPITREELVIENKILEPNESVDDNTKNVIRIPISEERGEVVKHQVLLNNISISKNEYQEIKQIEDTVKKEIVHLESIGNPIIIDNDELK